MIDLISLTEKFDKVSNKTLPLRGTKKIFTTYRIPLEYLRYNKENDRIATFITQYHDEVGEFPDNQESFNDTIEKFIVESDSNSFAKTRANIKAMGQIEAAVVLSNGIVIDGNRRFSVLRQLSREQGSLGGEFGYLEAVILPSTEYDEKDIKRLELNLQHAIESKVDYNPIERLVGIYRDLIAEGHPFEVKEYAFETQSSERQIKKEMEIATLLVEYLNFINKPEKFHIARKLQIDGPLREVHRILKSNKIDKSNYFSVKELLFANILSLDGDVTRKIRDLKSVVENPVLMEEILEDSENILDDISDELEILEDITESNEFNLVNISVDSKEKIQEITSKFVDAAKLSMAINQPIEALKKTIERIKLVDMESVRRFDSDTIEEFNNYLEILEEEIIKIKEIMDDK